MRKDTNGTWDMQAPPLPRPGSEQARDPHACMHSAFRNSPGYTHLPEAIRQDGGGDEEEDKGADDG